MQAARFALALVLISACLPVAALSAVFGHTYSIDEYVSELNRLSTLANQAGNDRNAAGAAIDDLRGGWRVEGRDQTFDLDTSWLLAQFEKLQQGSNEETRSHLRERISGLMADARAFQQPASDASSYRTTLSEILARSEFHQVHGPTWLDRLKYRIALWLFRLLSRFFDSSSVPVIGRSLVWTLVAIAVLALAWFIYREMKRNARLETIMPEVLPVSAKQWSVWMSEAQAAAAKGLWRDAVHLAYWAGISFLEERGMWRPDQARTPREYLQLISATSEHRPALSTLTRQLEVTWYGNQAAGPETFAETLAHLENLGCRQV
jgi:hypothetical protein